MPGVVRVTGCDAVVRIGRHFASVLPLALRVMTHPSFDARAMSRIQPGGPTSLHEAFAERLARRPHVCRRELVPGWGRLLGAKNPRGEPTRSHRLAPV